MPWTAARLAVRRLLQVPLFTTVTLVTLAVGIGANTAIFSIVYGVLLKPLPGRLFTKADDSPGAPQRVILTYGYWQRRFGGRDVLGQPITVDGKPLEIIGILPESFTFLDYTASIVLPLQFDRSKTFIGNFSYRGVARLKPGV